MPVLPTQYEISTSLASSSRDSNTFADTARSFCAVTFARDVPASRVNSTEISNVKERIGDAFRLVDDFQGIDDAVAELTLWSGGAVLEVTHHESISSKTGIVHCSTAYDTCIASATAGPPQVIQDEKGSNCSHGFKPEQSSR